MFSSSWKHFEFTLTLGKITMSLPLKWSQKESKIIESWQGKFRMLCIVLIILTYVSYLAFAISHDLKIHGKHLIGLEDILIRYVYMMGGLMAVMLYGNLYHYLETYMSYINEWIKLYNYIEGKNKVNIAFNFVIFLSCKIISEKKTAFSISQ